MVNRRNEKSLNYLFKQLANKRTNSLILTAKRRVAGDSMRAISSQKIFILHDFVFEYQTKIVKTSYGCPRSSNLRSTSGAGGCNSTLFHNEFHYI